MISIFKIFFHIVFFRIVLYHIASHHIASYRITLFRLFLHLLSCRAAEMQIGDVPREFINVLSLLIKMIVYLCLPSYMQHGCQQ